MNKKERIFVWGIVFFLFLLFFGLKCLQHETFNTYGYDLGIRTNILWNLKHRGIIWDSLHEKHGFSGHFHPIVFLLLIGFYLWESPLLLLLLKSIALALSFVPLFLLSEIHLKNDKKKFLIPLLFFINPYFFEVFRFDFHPEVFAIPLIFSFFYFIEKRKPMKALLAIVSTLLFKEDASILLFSAGIFMAMKKYLKYAVGMILGSMLYLYVVVFHIIPYYNQGKTLLYLHYSSLTPSSLFLSLFSVEKISSFLKFLLSFGLLPILSHSFLSTLPLFFEHLSSSYYHQYNLTHQYSVYLLSFMFYGFLKVLPKVSLPKKLFCIAFIFISLFNHPPNLFKEKIDMAKIKMLKQIIKKVPPGSSVCTINNLIPHFCLREKVCFFCNCRNYEYVIVDLDGNLYPYTHNLGKKKLDSLLNTTYKLLFAKDSIYLLKNYNSNINLH